MEADADTRAFEALAQHPRLGDLAALTRSVMTTAAETRRAERTPERVAELAKQLGVTREAAATPFGNALDVLERGPEDDAERALACALAAQVVATQPPTNLVSPSDNRLAFGETSGREQQERLAGDLLWLATHTPFDATGLLDRALGEAAAPLWNAVAERIRRADHGPVPGLGRGEALVAAVAMGASRSKGAVKEAAALAAEVRDRKIARVLSAPDAQPTPEPLAGEMTPAPRGPVATAVLAMTGILLVLQAARLLGRLVLAYRRPAHVSLAEDGGVRVKWRTELLGRTLRDRDVLVPRAALARATRELRYPGFAMYTGLVALAVGSLLGVSAFVDGVRAASPSLLGTGLCIVILGLGLDFMLTSLAPGSSGRCRVLFVSRDGTRLCVGGVDLKRADKVLARLGRP